MSRYFLDMWRSAHLRYPDNFGAFCAPPRGTNQVGLDGKHVALHGKSWHIHSFHASKQSAANLEKVNWKGKLGWELRPDVFLKWRRTLQSCTQVMALIIVPISVGSTHLIYCRCVDVTNNQFSLDIAPCMLRWWISAAIKGACSRLKLENWHFMVSFLYSESYNHCRKF